MMPDVESLAPVLRHSPVEVVFGPGSVAQLGILARRHGATRVLLVTDPGIEAAGHGDRAAGALDGAGLERVGFSGVVENPTTVQVTAGVQVAQAGPVDFIVAVGGGSTMDCAKGINLILTNGGSIQDYWGVDRNHAAMLPMIAVPTTAGTGSEAQSFALISDPQTHRKMACGVRALPVAGGLRPRAAILDPDLTASQPPEVARAAGIDAIAHAVETAACTARTAVSRALSRHAWDLLEPAYTGLVRGRTVGGRSGNAVRARMLLGAHLAGAAIEQSMLGGAHACANPLTARFGTVHGCAVGLMLPHVVRFNAHGGDNPYAGLMADPLELAERLARLLDAAGLPTRLRDIGVQRSDLPDLAALAEQEWTGTFNPRPLDRARLLGIYESAYE